MFTYVLLRNTTNSPVDITRYFVDVWASQCAPWDDPSRAMKRPMLSPKEASKHFPVSKSKIIRDISSGKLSASKNERGHFQIDPSELARVYGSGTSGSTQEATHGARWDDPNGTSRTAENALKITLVEQERDAAREMAAEREKTITGLRQRLDKAESARDAAQSKLAGLLTDQRPTADGAGGRQNRLWLAVLIALVVGGLVVWAVTQLPLASA